MSRTKRGSSKLDDSARTATPYKRQERRKLLRDFEREYIGHNKSPMIEL